MPLHRRIFRGIWLTLYFPVFCVWQFLQFIILSWTTTRSIDAFIKGVVPFLLASAIVALVIIWPFVELKSARRVHREYTINAEAAGNFPAALLGSRRVQLLTDEPSWKFLHALTMEKAGLTENAMQIMRELATYDKDCYPNAHVYLADKNLADYQNDPKNAELLSETLNHMTQVAEIEPDNIAIKVRIGKIKMMLGQTEDAMKIFKETSGIDPTVVPELAKYLLKEGKPEEASLHIQRGLAALKELAEKNPDDLLVWATMFQILIVKEDYSGALAELDKAYASSESGLTKVQLRRLQSDVVIEYCKKLESDRSDDGLRRQLKFVSDAILRFPRNPVAQEKFADLVLYTGNAPFEAWIDDKARENIQPGIFHLMNGMRDAVFGKPEDARNEFRLALGGNKAAAVLVTDMARMIANQKDRPEDGLRLLESAIGTWSNPFLNVARGEILMKLNRNQEALEELEYATQEVKSDPNIFEVLATCREKLGDTEGAQLARDRAEDLRLELIANRASEEMKAQ